MTPAQATEDAFLIFSGHNPRAVVTMCRYLTRVGIPFYCVAAKNNDAILTSAYKDSVLFQRDDSTVATDLFERAAKATDNRLVYCPSTEFINTFVLSNRAEIEAAGVAVKLPDQQIYQAITGKLSSPAFFRDAHGIRLPRDLPKDMPPFPCVVKPLLNIADGAAYYPAICAGPEDFSDARARFEDVGYFVQEFVTGESLYYCGHVSSDGEVIGFWQQNLLQQAGGKSVVFAVEDTRAHPDATQGVKQAVRASGYVGPFMVELLRSDTGYHYIETNPRLWGPLQLTMDVMPQVLDAFCQGYGVAPQSNIDRMPTTPAYYIWQGGIDESARRHIGLNQHPAFDTLASQWDVFGRPDFNDAA